MKKVKLELKFINGSYQVKKVTNSVEWSPGEVLSEITVTALVRRPQLEVVITQ